MKAIKTLSDYQLEELAKVLIAGLLVGYVAVLYVRRWINALR